jgi:hypothetical protein
MQKERWIDAATEIPELFQPGQRNNRQGQNVSLLGY